MTCIFVIRRLVYLGFFPLLVPDPVLYLGESRGKHNPPSHVIMSTTTTSTFTTTTLVGIPSAMKNGMTLSEKQCPMCGGNGDSHDAVESHRRIQELEGQVHALSERAAMTGKWED